jgi:hypothetical protein
MALFVLIKKVTLTKSAGALQDCVKIFLDSLPAR